MAMKPISAEEIAERQAEDEKLLPASGIVPTSNGDALRLLSTVREFEFPEASGIWYVCDRVPYYEGTQIKDIYNRIREIRQFPDHAAIGIFDKMLDEAVDIAWKLVRPKDKLTRFLKWTGIMSNVFKKHMSEAEVAALISFFLARRMTSSVSFRFPAVKQGQSR